MRVFIFLSNIVNIYSFVLRDTNIFLSKESADFKIEINIDDDDYEMIDKNQLKDFSVNNEQFRKLDELASMEYTKRTTLKTDVRSYKNILLGMTKATNPNNVISVTNPPTLSTQKRKKTTEKVYEYNYNLFINEYYHQGDKEAVWHDTADTNDYYDIANIFKNIFLSQKNIDYSNNSIGLEAIKVLVKDYTTHQRPMKDIAARLWKIAQIWFLVYLIVAVPLWCTRGWCCCCLFCKFFKPLKTIEEAKKYLITNPPGVFRTKTGEIIYHPTEQEKEAYEEFEHFIKTL